MTYLQMKQPVYYKNFVLKITWDATEVLVEETEETGSPLKNTPVMPRKILKKCFVEQIKIHRYLMHVPIHLEIGVKLSAVALIFFLMIGNNNN